MQRYHHCCHIKIVSNIVINIVINGTIWCCCCWCRPRRRDLNNINIITIHLIHQIHVIINMIKIIIKDNYKFHIPCHVRRRFVHTYIVDVALVWDVLGSWGDVTTVSVVIYLYEFVSFKCLLIILSSGFVSFLLVGGIIVANNIRSSRDINIMIQRSMFTITIISIRTPVFSHNDVKIFLVDVWITSLMFHSSSTLIRLSLSSYANDSILSLSSYCFPICIPKSIYSIS